VENDFKFQTVLILIFDYTLVNLLHSLLNFEIGGLILSCYYNRENITSVHWIHM